ncbi:hypothetical protein UUU_45160 [Klebsiella pneumoniae subsp. pneumoniae DSM 30104 = JCM 1662 = NBRC 14940]|nr:hypothetical protein UUU_45160 [Klebsiella pneumoniae subsp. pneumoniae DSM 30104 = JCM 1662 = NBRC 14940]
MDTTLSNSSDSDQTVQAVRLHMFTPESQISEADHNYVT